jgi:enoyl-CoA hydratase/carnithine racemase
VPLELNKQTQWTELILNDPPRNVLDRKTLESLVNALDELSAADAPLLLIRSRGRHFSTGYSIKDIPEDIFHRDPAVRASHPFEMLMDRMIHYPAPIVVAVQGDAYGGAVEMLSCADIRVGVKGMRLGVPPVRLGLVYSHTGLRRMIRSFGSPLVREMLLLGEAITAERATQAGFFNRLVDAEYLDETVAQLLTTMAQGGPRALRGTKRILTLLEEAELLPDEVLEEISRLRHDSWSGEEFSKARDAFLSRGASPDRR